MNKTGFGFLRLPRTEDDGIDCSVLNPMVDHFLELGGTYFDTAYTYLDGLSEEAIRKAVVERHPRSSFVIADKLPGYMVKAYDECRTYLLLRLKSFVDYFVLFVTARWHCLMPSGGSFFRRNDMQFRKIIVQSLTPVGGM